MGEKFAVETIEAGLRFVATDGWVDLQILGDGRGNLWTGTYNGTTPEIFGKRLFDLLQEIMPELGLRVVSAEICPPDGFLDILLISAGFQKDGTRRRWGDNLGDVSCYSILDSEVRYVVAEPPVAEAEYGVLPTG